MWVAKIFYEKCWGVAGGYCVVVWDKNMSDSDDVKAWRKTTHLTQRSAADAIGVSIRTLQSWEQGRRVPLWGWKLMAYVETHGVLG